VPFPARELVAPRSSHQGARIRLAENRMGQRLTSPSLGADHARRDTIVDFEIPHVIGNKAAGGASRLCRGLGVLFAVLAANATPPLARRVAQCVAVAAAVATGNGKSCCTIETARPCRTWRMKHSAHGAGVHKAFTKPVLQAASDPTNPAPTPLPPR
jgi:hypothetical protein